MVPSINIKSEKISIQPVLDPEVSQPPSVKDGIVVDSNEVFKSSADGVDFGTVTWQRLIIILLKVQVATGVPGIPSAMGTLGAVPGSLVVVGWQALNTCKHRNPEADIVHVPDYNGYRHSLRSDRFPQQTPTMPQ